MPTILSHRHIKMTINGIRITGFADDDQPVSFPNIEMVDPKFGKDGSLYGTDTGMLGGEVTIKLLPAAPFVKQCLNWMAERHKLVRRTFYGTYGDNQLNFQISMLGGMLKSCTSASTPGQTFEIVFVFEELIPDYDNAKFLAVNVNDYSAIGGSDVKSDVFGGNLGNTGSGQVYGAITGEGAISDDEIV